MLANRVKWYFRYWRDKIVSFRGSRAKTLTEVEDFIERHGDAIAKALDPVPVKHTCPYPPGAVEWFFTWKFPFVRKHVYNTICLCDIVHILDQLNDDVIERAQAQPIREVIHIDVGEMSPREQRRVVKLWRLSLRRHLGRP